MILSRLLMTSLVIPPFLLVADWVIGGDWIAVAFFYTSIAASVFGLLTLIGALILAMLDKGLPQKVIIRAVWALVSPLWLFWAFFVIATMHLH
ncbi:MAG: hypothetical protein KA368_03690 [Acidobacteria bacterium]|nr:hypothetical protein [Acidobacteriota bacterium]